MSVVRPIVFVCCAAFIVFAPGYREVLNGTIKVPEWHMFTDRGLGVYKVRFETDAAGGGRRELDRFEELGYQNRWAAPEEVRLFTRKSEAWAVAKQLCDRLGGGNAVYMRLEGATESGWLVVSDGSTDVCKSRPRSSTGQGP